MKKTKTITNKLQTFINRCLHRIVGVKSYEKTTNAGLMERTKRIPVIEKESKRRWRSIGRTFRTPANSITRKSFHWCPQDKRNIGKPKNSPWRRVRDRDKLYEKATEGTARGSNR